MSKFVVLINWNEGDPRQREGKKTIEQLAEQADVTVESMVFVMGRFDAIAVLDGDVNRVGAVALALGQDGTVTTETLQAFDGPQAAQLAEDAAKLTGGEGKLTGGTGGT